MINKIYSIVNTYMIFTIIGLIGAAHLHIDYNFSIYIIWFTPIVTMFLVFIIFIHREMTYYNGITKDGIKKFDKNTMREAKNDLYIQGYYFKPLSFFEKIFGTKRVPITRKEAIIYDEYYSDKRYNSHEAILTGEHFTFSEKRLKEVNRIKSYGEVVFPSGYIIIEG